MLYQLQMTLRQKNISQKQIAKELKLSEQTISKKMNRNNEFTSLEKYKILKLINEPIEKEYIYFSHPYFEEYLQSEG